VLARCLELDENPKSSRGKKILLAAAAQWLDAERPGDSNQALMELGATVCMPRRPRCLLCPLRPGCRAAAAGTAELFPLATRKRERERVELVAAVVRLGERTLLFRRPEDSTVLGGTWEVPWVERTEGGDPADDLARRYGGSWRLGVRWGEVRHGITYRDLRVEVWAAELSAGDGVAEGPEAGWFDSAERARLALSSLVAKVLEKVPGPAGSPRTPV
jgi:A/G-specific adenine glycosylase